MRGRVVTRRIARLRVRFAAGMLTAAGSGAAAAQSADVDPFHSAYAPIFGTGSYRLGDGTEARIVRVALAKWLRKADYGSDSGVGIRLLLPVTIGTQNLDDEDLPAGREAGRIEHVSILPGLELEFPRSERWTLRASGQAGWGKELEGTESAARMLALGVRSRYRWLEAPGRPSLINGLLWAGFDPDDGARRSLLRMTHAVEFDVAVPRWQFRDAAMHLRPHVLGDWYYRLPAALSFGDDPSALVETEWQLGIAAGREGGFRILGFELDSVGIAYRFSEHSRGIRFLLGSVF